MQGIVASICPEVDEVRHARFSRGTCKMRNEIETKRNKSKRNSPKRNEIETKRNGIIQNEIKPILTKQFLGEIQDKN
jgi:hypothetical protein